MLLFILLPELKNIPPKQKFIVCKFAPDLYLKIKVMKKYFLTIFIFTVLIAKARAQARASYLPLSIPTRDNKTLAADLYALDTTKALPVILIQTPYNKNSYSGRGCTPKSAKRNRGN